MAAIPATAYAVSIVVALSPQSIHSGTAFAVTSDAHTTEFVTAAHVIADATRVVIVLQDGSDFPATIVARDRVRDAAILSIGVGNRPVLAISKSTPSRDDAMTVIGYPGARQFSIEGADVKEAAVAEIVAGGRQG